MLAVGISYEHEGFCGSRLTDQTNPKDVSDFLESEFGLKFDDILIIKNDEVIHSWHVDEDF